MENPLSNVVLIEFRRTFKKELARIPDDEFLTKGEVASLILSLIHISEPTRPY